MHKHDAKIHVEIDGLAASAASFVAMVGDHITIAEHGLMMVHDPWSVTMGNSNDHRKTAEKLDQVKDSIISIYAARTSLTTDRLSRMLADETWFNADEAIEHGFADEILANKSANNNYNFDPVRHKYKNAPTALKQQADAHRLALAKRRMLVDYDMLD